MSLTTEDTKDLTQYTDRELELMVFNTEYLYDMIDITNKAKTIDNLASYFKSEGYKFTGWQWYNLLQAIRIDIKERANEI